MGIMGTTQGTCGKTFYLEKEGCLFVCFICHVESLPNYGATSPPLYAHCILKSPTKSKLILRKLVAHSCTDDDGKALDEWVGFQGE
jgi:hypothetical protein